MKRNIVHIDQSKCNGCGMCAEACHEQAIVMRDGKAWLLRDDYCDGLGDCLPACPTNAITIEEREAAPYDEAAVIARQFETARVAAEGESDSTPDVGSGFVCPGSAPKVLDAQPDRTQQTAAPAQGVSRLSQWPVQMKLLPVSAPFYQGCKLLVAADCCAYSYAGFHDDFIAGRVCIIGCTKLDSVDYAEKLSAIIASNDIREICVTRMEVPCCGGMTAAVKRAFEASGRNLPLRIVTFSRDGKVIADDTVDV